MDDQDKTATNEESTSENPQRIEDGRRTPHPIPATPVSLDDPGPSGTISIPGAVPSPLLTSIKPGLSKSEHNLRHIFTNKDVANALKLTSLSFDVKNPTVRNLDLKEVKIPVVEPTNPTAERMETSNLLELRKFMASCLTKLSNVVADASPNRVPHGNHTECVLELANSSCVTHVDATGVITPVIRQNEVVVAHPIIEAKMSKLSQNNSNKKKTSGSLSERSDLGLAQRDSLSSIGSNVCRICMTRGRERLISPCNCKGSLANVHLSCLERWLNQVGRNHCELCGYSYPAIRTPRYTVLQALRLWFGNPRNRSHLQSDCLIFWLLSTVTAGLLAVCIVGTQYFVIEGNKFGKLDASARKEEGILSGISHRITETAMDFFMAIVLCGYSVTVYLLWKDHYVMWNRWRRANVNVRLLLSPDANPVPFVPRARYNVV